MQDGAFTLLDQGEVRSEVGDAVEIFIIVENKDCLLIGSEDKEVTFALMFVNGVWEPRRFKHCEKQQL